VRTPNLRGSYAGDCLNGFASGRGVAKGIDRYEGSFRDGQPTGPGVYTYADGRRFEGDFIDGQVQGRAKFAYGNGDVLEGSFRDSVLVGIGRMRRGNGEVLLVEFRNGAFAVVATASPAPVPTQVPVPAPAPATPAVVPPPATAAPVPATHSPAATAATAGAAAWSPQIDFDDIFPSYVFATATRKPPQAPAAAGSRSAGDSAPRGDELGAMTPAQWLGRTVAAAPARSRVASVQADAHYMGDPWGLVGIRLRNEQPGAEVKLRVQIDDVAEPTEAVFVLPTAGEYALYPRIRWRFERLRQIGQSIPVNVSWQLSIGGVEHGNRSAVTRVRPLQDAPLAVQTSRGVERTLWVFAGFVTEEAPWLDELIREAFAARTSGALGYQVGPAEVDGQVKAVYDMLKRRGVKYSSITTTAGASGRVASQTVRFPSDAMRTAQANCIDGTVLMASILRKMGVEPIIVTGPGHALLGYFRQRPGSGDKPDVRFVETTAIGSDSFEGAVREGERQVNEWLEKAAEDPRFQFMPVHAWRRNGVMSIPR
jgi:hypothetical protein